MARDIGESVGGRQQRSGDRCAGVEAAKVGRSVWVGQQRSGDICEEGSRGRRIYVGRAAKIGGSLCDFLLTVTMTKSRLR
jgi:hypothetical protein